MTELRDLRPQTSAPLPAAPTAPPPPSLRGIVVRAVVVALGLLAAGVLVVDWDELLLGQSRQWTNDAYLRGDPRQLSARLSGYVGRVAIADYQVVKAGDLLFEVEDADYRAQRDRAQAALAQAEAAQALAQAQAAQQESQVEVARRTIDATAADLRRAQLEQVRQEELRNTPAFIPRIWDQASADAQRLQATIAGNRADLGAQQAQLAVLRAGLEQAAAAVLGARAALEQAQVTLRYTRVVAPADGMVGSRAVRVGQYVQPGTLLTQFVPLDHVWAVANFRESQLGRMQAGQRAQVTVDAYPGTVLHGRVDSFEPGSQALGSLLPPDRAVGSFTKIVQRLPVKILLDDPGPLAGRLLPGLSVEVTVETTDP
ncbi:HlyD family secretion protein [Paracraurococcus lichenis]|uniref:HlyD family secretion protein n=1 Tax=Paracraurococcus lichenis TaxID=3064888 RepID=A0ABT9E382_9PROT|nr:HlyD family secretion protein [Paracraurococcus sp. LOR1-02]MDO9710562.1 HlyD family secretion protein [Paracraurococcus sp. LOR1-02]